MTTGLHRQGSHYMTEFSYLQSSAVNVEPSVNSLGQCCSSLYESNCAYIALPYEHVELVVCLSVAFLPGVGTCRLQVSGCFETFCACLRWCIVLSRRVVREKFIVFSALCFCFSCCLL